MCPFTVQGVSWVHLDKLINQVRILTNNIFFKLPTALKASFFFFVNIFFRTRLVCFAFLAAIYRSKILWCVYSLLRSSRLRKWELCSTNRLTPRTEQEKGSCITGYECCLQRHWFYCRDQEYSLFSRFFCLTIQHFILSTPMCHVATIPVRLKG